MTNNEFAWFVVSKISALLEFPYMSDLKLENGELLFDGAKAFLGVNEILKTSNLNDVMRFREERYINSLVYTCLFGCIIGNSCAAQHLVFSTDMNGNINPTAFELVGDCLYSCSWSALSSMNNTYRMKWLDDKIDFTIHAVLDLINFDTQILNIFTYYLMKLRKKVRSIKKELKESIESICIENNYDEDISDIIMSVIELSIDNLDFYFSKNF